MSAFRKEESIHSILYILNKLGGKCDIHKLSKILYFADEEHLAKYGRSITEDTYIAMQYGPVPSRIYDIFKALRPDSFFHFNLGDISDYISDSDGRFIIANQEADMDFLSDSELECLDNAINKCRYMTFDQLIAISHDYAWNHTARDGQIDVSDILREAGEDELYIAYLAELQKMRSVFQ